MKPMYFFTPSIGLGTLSVLRGAETTPGEGGAYGTPVELLLNDVSLIQRSPLP